MSKNYSARLGLPGFGRQILLGQEMHSEYSACARLSTLIGCVMLSVLCAACEPNRKEEKHTKNAEVSIDRLIELADSAKDEIVRRSPKPDDWGDLRLAEYDPDFRMSGSPAFTYVDRSTVVIEELGKIGYRDLEFVIEDGKVADIQSRSRAILTSWAEDVQFIKTVADFAEFPHPVSFYVERASGEILKTEGDRIPKGAKDLRLARIRFEYFDRPQIVVISFRQVSTTERTEYTQSSTTFHCRLDPMGKVVTKNEEADQSAAPR